MKPIEENHEYNRYGSDNDIGESSYEHKDALGPACTCGGMSSSDMMMTVAIDNEKSKSICGIGNDARSGNDLKGSIIGGNKTNSVWLESSFVHLMTPRKNIRTANDYNENMHHPSSDAQPQTQQHSQRGFLEEHQLLLQLLEAANIHADDGHDCKNNNPSVELCVDCIDRVAAALEADTQRLYSEVETYRETVRVSKQRSKTLQRTTKHATGVGIAATNKNDDFVNNNTIEEAYQEEIAMLEREIQARSDELLHYKKIHREQTKVTCELSQLEEGLQQEENSLELQSEAFDNRRQVLTKTLAEVQNEVDKLTCVSIPRVLFDLQVDQARGLHYPLINQLRLAFRPKGDVPAQEIQVAWSQATQLLLLLGTLFEYPGLDWKLVPLADCAKLIYRKEIFNLVPGDCRSLMAWNALLDQVVKHALSLGAADHVNSTRTKSTKISSRNNDPTPTKPTLPPYPSSPTMIGNTELARLDPIDHVSWSQVIHRMASNLLWLSNRASSLSATQVSSLAHCVV
mmetsp:Transcript_13031/g.32897  ORF Transcript_13031/g.32897 Transcript_13031/m.32897 type:complete len:514 (+) Transcript_13031:106-1647(+)